jgi:hypothetical protein
MTYQFPRYPDSPLAARRTGAGGSSARSEQAWTLADFVPVLLFSAIGLLTAFYLIGREATYAAEQVTPRAATENVLPPLVVPPESLEPNLNGVLATGDGGASIPLEELVGGVSRDAFKNNLAHARAPTSTPAR